jgi:hypothetical protein
MKKVNRLQHIITCLIMACSLLFTTGCKKDEKPKYSLTVNILPAGSGTVDLSPTGVTFEEGTIVNLTASPNLGYSFSEWSGDAVGSINPTTVTMDADKTINASFEEGVMEDFNDGVADNFIADGSRWSVTNSAYVMTGTRANTSGYSYYPFTFSDFGISVDMQVTSTGSDSHAFGIYLKSQSGVYNVNSYRLSMMNDGSWYFGIYLNGNFSFITGGWISSGDLNTGNGAINNIKVLFVGTQADIYFNDVYQGYIYNMTDFTSGYAGVLGYDSDSYDNVFSFDNFRIVTSDINNFKSAVENNSTGLDLTTIKGIQRDPEGR